MPAAVAGGPPGKDAPGGLEEKHLRKLQEVEGENFPAGSLQHLYAKAENAEETKLARKLRIPTPNEV